LAQKPRAQNRKTVIAKKSREKTSRIARISTGSKPSPQPPSSDLDKLDDDSELIRSGNAALAAMGLI
jgi:hypothetical protein